MTPAGQRTLVGMDGLLSPKPGMGMLRWDRRVWITGHTEGIPGALVGGSTHC